jgi:nicotinamidase-related amidase
MPNLKIDPATTALVIIDLQNSVASRQLAPYTAAEVIQRSAALAAVLRQHGGMVVYVRVKVGETLSLPADKTFPRPAQPPPPEASELVPGAGFQSGDVLITKRQWGAFYATDLDQQLRRRGIRTVIMAGIATNIGVESTARAAHERGYELIFVEDAMSSMSTEMHQFAMQQIFPLMGHVRSSQEIAAALSTVR